MKPKFSKIKSLFERDLIQKNEGRLTYVQIGGFVLITLGVIYLASFLLPSGIIEFAKPLELENEPTGTGVAIAFFTIMLGVSLAFPEMLRDQVNDISTMRIVVFMLVNVICVLLIKIGWDADSLDDIGLNGYWVSIIALLFGAKAAQSFFENAGNLLPAAKNKDKDEALSMDDMAWTRLAVRQNSDLLHAKYSNIVSISDTMRRDGQRVVAIYLADDDDEQIPETLTAKLANGEKRTIPTEVIDSAGPGRPQIGQATDEVSDNRYPSYYGSICCLVESTDNPDLKGAVTAGHIFTHGDYFNYKGWVSGHNQHDALIRNIPKGKLHFQQMTYNRDVAIVELASHTDLFDGYMAFNDSFHEVSDEDLMTEQPNVRIISRRNKQRDGYILDYNFAVDIHYQNTTKYIRNIILIGSCPDRKSSRTLSEGGDSGSCVFEISSNKLIGILLGGNLRYTFVLPIQHILQENHFKVI